MDDHCFAVAKESLVLPGNIFSKRPTGCCTAFLACGLSQIAYAG